MPIDQAEIEGFQSNLAAKRERIATIAKWHLDMYIGTDGATDLPYSGDDTYIYCTVRPPDSYNDVDVPATLALLKAVAKFASKQPNVTVEKDYDTDFTLKVKIPANTDPNSERTITIRYTANREAVCTRKVVGTEVIPAYTTPERVQDVVEWECEKVALLK